MSAPLAHSAARGLYFTLGAQLARIVLQLASVAVLARLLTPHDYGLFALVLLIVGAGEVFRDFGLTSASIQAPTLTNGQRSRLFWINTLIGVILATVVYVASWPSAWLANEAALGDLVRALSVLFIINGLATQYRASLLRDLRFKAVAVIDVSAAALGLFGAVAAALATWGFWALAVQQFVTALVALIGAVAVCRWIPSSPLRGEPVGSLVRFGWNVVATNIFMYAGNQVDTLLIATRLGTTSLGFYTRAYQLVMTPVNQIRGPINSVAQPVFARVQSDPERFPRYVTAGQLALGYSVGLALAVLAALASPVVTLMLGPTWTQSAPLLALFCVAAFFSNVSLIGYWVYVSRGLVNQLFRYSLVSLTVKVTCLLVGSCWGLEGVAAGFALAPAISWPISLFWLSRITTIPVRALYLGAARIISVGVVIAAFTWLSGPLLGGALLPIAQIAIGAVAALIVAASLLAVPIVRRDGETLLWFGRLMLSRER